MATLYLKTGAANWNDAASWSTVSAGGGDSSGPPTAADDCIAELLSGNVTIAAAAVCRSFDTTSGTGSWAGTLTHNAAITLTIGNGTAGAGNVALKLNSGITYTLGNSSNSAISYVSTSGTLQTIDYGGKVPGNITFNGSGGNWTFTTNVPGSSATALTVTLGTLHFDGTGDVSGLFHTFGTFNSNNTNARTLNLGTSSISILGAFWTNQTPTNLTLIAGTSSIIFSSTNATMLTGGKTFYDVSFIGSGTAGITDASSSFHNLTRTGTAAKTDTFDIAANQTITGTLTVNGNSATNRILIQSTVLSTARTLTVATVSMSNVDLRGITGAGAGSWDLSAITGLSGDCGGNSGITFTSDVATSWVSSTSGNWSNSGKWSPRVPLPQDSVSLNNAFSASQTVTADMPRLGKSIDWTGATGSPTFALNSTPNTIYGSLTLISAMTLSVSQNLTFEGRGSFTLTSAGKTFGAQPSIAMVGGTLTLQDALSVTNTLSIFSTTIFNSNNFNVTVNSFSTSNSPTINMGSGVFTINGQGTPWSVSAATVNAGTSTIFITDTSSNAKTFAGGGKTYYDLKIAGGGSGAVIITGANTFNRIYTDGGGTKSVTLPGSTTTTLLSGLGLANGTNVITFTASAGSATLSKAAGNLSWDYINLTNIPSTGGAKFYAGKH